MSGWSNDQITKTCSETNLERFVAKFYASPQSCEQIFCHMQDATIDGKLLRDPRPDRLLLTLYYLKKYPDKHDLGAFVQSTEKSALSWAKGYVDYIQALKEKKASTVGHEICVYFFLPHENSSIIDSLAL